MNGMRDKLDAVIAHEMSHVIRRDALSRCLSLLHRALFWFSPLAWWLNRHIAELAEEVSDEAALSAGAERSRHARTLLGFFKAVQDAPRRIHRQGVSIANAGKAERRLGKILAWRGAHTMRLTIHAAASAARAASFLPASRKLSHDLSEDDLSRATDYPRLTP